MSAASGVSSRDTDTIPCLRCRQPFASTDRRRNRICSPCKVDTADLRAGLYDPAAEAMHRGDAACGGGRWVSSRVTDNGDKEATFGSTG